ncbi:hypothetical protein EGW08_004100 [Elysia chlorotica]|uniref:Lengsin n=1 Tax=Elysia chlorotica TaxID=188477 RepID=A0A433U2Z9_ELYCH|nr:hypothetical protein EGW08_004100 [Elysia chlorotica]
MAVTQLVEDILMDLVESMKKIGIKIETVMQESSSGQFEMTFAVVEGIEAADMLADFKTAAYVYLQKKGLNVEFMTCLHPGLDSNGCHYNFSLWDSHGRNVFADLDDEEKLSTISRHWLAGMVEHAPAMVALMCPTINCFRRIGSEWAPQFANWAEENRMASFRVKIERGGNVYIENRLPSGACNPYLVLAGTLAAGMDGLRRKLVLPRPMDESLRLPPTLGDALIALEMDGLMREALGEKLVELFVHSKRTFEVDEFKAFGELSDEEMLLKEKEYYYHPY